VVTFRDVNIEDLTRKDIRPEEAMGRSDRAEPTEGPSSS
jgi:hypothetical protein